MEQSKTRVINENSKYFIAIGSTEEINTPHYLVVNKEYGIIEAETAIYPQALKYASDLEAALVALEDISIDDKKSKIVPIKGNKELH